MATARTPREKWIEAGLDALAEGGPEAVRVEALAKTLGVTKGGFYGYFSNRDALLTAMLDSWEREVLVDVVELVDRAELDPRERLRTASQLPAWNRLLPIDIAIRGWARGDAQVAERLHRVDNKRMDQLREIFSAFCDDPDEVEARSLLAFCLAIGSQFLSVDHEGRTAPEVVAKAADYLLTSPRDTDQRDDAAKTD